MATSGVYSLTIARDDIIRQAMLNIRRLDPDKSPTARETLDCAFMLNLMVVQWQGKADFAPGLKVWTRKRGHLMLSPSTNTYTLGPSAQGWTNTLAQTTLANGAALGAGSVVVASTAGLSAPMNIGVQLDSQTIFYTTISSVVGTTVNLASPLTGTAASGNSVYAYSAAAQMPVDIQTAVLRDNQNEDTPLGPLTLEDYDNLPSKADITNVGDPAAFLYETGLTSGTLFIDVGAAQDTSKHIVLTYLEPVQVFTTTTDEPYFPREWYLPLCWGLAEQICPMFGVNWTPKMEALKNTALAIARNKDAEISSLFFQPGEDG